MQPCNHCGTKGNPLKFSRLITGMKVSEVTKSNKRAAGTEEVRRGNDAFCVKQTATASQT